MSLCIRRSRRQRVTEDAREKQKADRQAPDQKRGDGSEIARFDFLFAMLGNARFSAQFLDFGDRYTPLNKSTPFRAPTASGVGGRETSRRSLRKEEREYATLSADRNADRSGWPGAVSIRGFVHSGCSA